MKQPYICVFGGGFSNAEKKKLEETTTPYFYHDDSDVKTVIMEKEPHVLISIGEDCRNFKFLMNLSYSERKKWLHFSNIDDLMKKLESIYFCFVSYSINNHQDDNLVTVFSSSYKSGDYIMRPFETLLKQTHQNWEWVIFDDSDGDENFANLVKLRDRDPRVRVYRAEKNSGVIGHMKNLASSLGRGSILMEVDHDDELTDKALEYCLKAAKEYPEAGFFFSDFCEILEDGDNFSYGDMFALGYGSYRKEWHEGRKKWINICNSPPVTAITIRYLVGCPNHYRAWRTSVFKKIGGWNHNFHVADDYEIMVRSFLNTKFVRIPHNAYFQYRNRGGNNHTFIRNKEIQKLWRTISRFYNHKIHDRLLELNKEDKYYPNWENWRPFKRCWYVPEYEEWLHETLDLKGTSTKPLVSVVIVCDENSTIVRRALEVILRQSYEFVEVMIVGDKCSQLEGMMEGMIGELEKECFEINTIMNINGRDGIEFKPSINLDRLKNDVKWWNLQDAEKMGWEATVNYALKLSTLGKILYVVDLRTELPLEELEIIEKFGPDCIKHVIDLLVKDEDLMGIKLNNSRQIFTKNKLYQKYGYWWKDKDLYKLWYEGGEKIVDLTLV